MGVFLGGSQDTVCERKVSFQSMIHQDQVKKVTYQDRCERRKITSYIIYLVGPLVKNEFFFYKLMASLLFNGLATSIRYSYDRVLE